jgi:hypothetical protein
MCGKPNLLPFGFIQFAALVYFHVARIAQTANKVVIRTDAPTLTALPICVCGYYRSIIYAAMLAWDFAGVS